MFYSSKVLFFKRYLPKELGALSKIYKIT